MAVVGGPGAGAVGSFAGVVVLGVCCAAPLRGGGGPVRLPVLALALLALPALLLMLVSLVEPLSVDRSVLYGHAGTALLIGAALDRLGRARAAALLAAGAAAVALLPCSAHLRTPISRTDDLTAIAQAVREAGRDADGVLYLPRRRRVWSLPDPTAVRGLRDIALDRTPADSHALYGTEVTASVVRARVLTTPRIVAVGDPEGQPLDRTGPELVKRRVLDTYFEECRVWRVQGARIAVSARPGRC
ncbi:hypothetical protein [Streptomyces sp. TRM70350]|uniref:hypothetical protein n=1 Tax=Streptomyces sp. TRM70350 TaxID=2856165 RepID=UPI001C444B2C|nr:hypothetical protein [Streptomyces sp. TRM70350]MBV7694212.1 hypothetical protein [Streptomyces sp. TRM70350]